jgi:hypothetical protein
MCVPALTAALLFSFVVWCGETSTSQLNIAIKIRVQNAFPQVRAVTVNWH